MKPGDIIICVDNTGALHLNLGQKYIVKSTFRPADGLDRIEIEIMIESVFGFTESYYASRFKPFNREKKLERILK
jgi:RNA binding exosome subunit